MITVTCISASCLLWWSSGVLVQYSQAMNTQSHASIHSYFGGLCQRRGGTLAISMALYVFASWNSGYIHGFVFVPEKGWKSGTLYVFLAGLRYIFMHYSTGIILWALFVYCYINYLCLIGTLSR